MTLSILHRMSGVALSVGLVLLVTWLVAAATGGALYASVTALLQSMPGQVLLVAWSFAFFFHLLNGIRHLFWDFGLGLEKSQANASAWLVVVLTGVLTLAYWFLL